MFAPVRSDSLRSHKASLGSFMAWWFSRVDSDSLKFSSVFSDALKFSSVLDGVNHSPQFLQGWPWVAEVRHGSTGFSGVRCDSAMIHSGLLRLVDFR